MLKVKFHKYLIFLLLFGALTPAAGQEQDYKELWAGKFTQSSPMAWDGEVELFIRYTVKKSKVVPFEGILSWPGLGNTKSRVSGKMSETEISFVEKECVSGDCSKIFSGAKYTGKIDKSYSEIKGSSELEITRPIGAVFKGSFILHRVEAQKN